MRGGLGAPHSGPLFSFPLNLPRFLDSDHSVSSRSRNGFCDAGAVAVSAGLAGLTRLEVLYLHSNGIGSAGGLAVAREAARLPALRTLRLRSYEDDVRSANGMTEADRAAIRAMLPRVTDGLGYL